MINDYNDTTLFTIKQLPTSQFKIKYNEMSVTKLVKGRTPFGIENYNNKKIINIEIDEKICNTIIGIEKFVQRYFDEYKLQSSIRKKPPYKPLLRTYVKLSKEESSNDIKIIIVKNKKRLTQHEINKFSLKDCRGQFEIYLDHIWKHGKKIGLLWTIDTITLI
jgi:DNA polymerase II small subunit/DNA polymerase delta subunit B